MKPISEWTVEEVNKYIHVKIMANCIHTVEPGHVKMASDRTLHCRRCGNENVGFIIRFPDYCSSDSPRCVLEEVVAKWKEDRSGVLLAHFYEQITDEPWAVHIMFMTAEQIARACCAAHAEGERNV